MNNLDNTISWILKNAPVSVREDVKELITLIPKQATNTINTMDLLNAIDDVIRGAETVNGSRIKLNEIDKLISNFNVDFYRFCVVFQDMGINLPVDDDILKLIHKVEDDNE